VRLVLLYNILLSRGVKLLLQCAKRSPFRLMHNLDTAPLRSSQLWCKLICIAKQGNKGRNYAAAFFCAFEKEFPKKLRSQISVVAHSQEFFSFTPRRKFAYNNFFTVDDSTRFEIYLKQHHKLVCARLSFYLKAVLCVK
jgi:hypothetical protein